MFSETTTGHSALKDRKVKSMTNSTLNIPTPAFKRGCYTPLLIAALLWAAALPAVAEPGQDNRAPDVPVALAVPDGNKVSFHAYAVGVQIYVATPSPADAAKLSGPSKHRRRFCSIMTAMS